jgi:hypothetical protein
MGSDRLHISPQTVGLVDSFRETKAIFYLKHLSMLLQSAETIVDVFDRYDLKDSIKSAERECRSQAAGGHRIYHVNEGKLINSCLFLLIDKNFCQSGMLLPSFT